MSVTNNRKIRSLYSGECPSPVQLLALSPLPCAAVGAMSPPLWNCWRCVSSRLQLLALSRLPCSAVGAVSPPLCSCWRCVSSNLQLLALYPLPCSAVVTVSHPLCSCWRYKCHHNSSRESAWGAVVNLELLVCHCRPDIQLCVFCPSDCRIHKVTNKI